MWVKALLIILSIFLITVTLPRSMSAVLDNSYRWQAWPERTERIEQLKAVNALGINKKRMFELGRLHYAQAATSTNKPSQDQAYTEAIEVFTALLDYDPHHKSGIQYMAAIYTNQKKYAESQVYFSRILAIMTQRDFRAYTRLSYYKMCLNWSYAFESNQQFEEEKFLLQKARDIFASTQPFLYWRWSGVKRENQTILTYIDSRLITLSNYEAKAPESFIEISF